MTQQYPIAEPRERYLLDANVFMAAWNDHYPIDLFPGFWAALVRYAEIGALRSVDRISWEIDSPDELVAWVQSEWRDHFVDSGDARVCESVGSMKAWVQENPQFSARAERRFAREEDGWLAAYAKVHGYTVVTEEAVATDARRRVPLPSVCEQFAVRYTDTVGMLRELGVRFDLR